MQIIARNPVLSKFQCLGDKCEDTCCQNWSMQVDEQTYELYKTTAPELLATVEAAAETPWIMRKNPATGFCVKLEGGLCGIHKEYGDRYLGDACHFYPRATRALGSKVLMTATLSCPEIARLSLFEDLPPQNETAEAERLPNSLKNYLPDGMSEDEALSVHQIFIDAAADKEADAELIFLRIACTSRQLDMLPANKWPILTSFYMKDADQRLPTATRDINDPYNLLHALCGLIVASHKPASTRLMETIRDMEAALAATLDWGAVSIATSDASLPALSHLQHCWYNEAKTLYNPILRRWLGMQMALNLHPFGGLGQSLTERVTLLGMRLAITKLALVCGHAKYGALTQDQTVRIVQSLSRFLDHLGDSTFSIAIATETGWINEDRMHGLLRF